MRGKDDEGRLKLRHVGITPAYAGKSALQLCTDSCSRDHPRVCGEKFRAYAKIWNEWGSPPRMRGKVLIHEGGHTRSGITPAYAGKRDASADSSGLMRDHPRVCGEKRERMVHDRYGRRITPAYAGKSSTSAVIASQRPGSPPRMRGKATEHYKRFSAFRITPAYAGKR